MGLTESQQNGFNAYKRGMDIVTVSDDAASPNAMEPRHPAPSESKTIDEIIALVNIFAKRLLKEYGYPEDTLNVTRIVKDAEKKEKAVMWKKAKEERNNRLELHLNSVENFEVRKRLAVLSNNAQSIYHLLRENAGGSKTSLTVVAMAEMVGLSPRSVGSALSELREVGLIASTGSKKLPEITIIADLQNSFDYGRCLLFQSIKTNEGKRRMRLVCGQCQLLSCPAHPERNMNVDNFILKWQ